MPSDAPISQIVNVPTNEPQPNHDEQLDESLSKLFSTDDKPITPSETVDKKDEITDKKVEVKTEETKDLSNKSEVPKPEVPTEEEIKAKPNKEGWKVLRDSHAKAKQTIKEKDEELSKLKLSLADRGQTTSQEAEALKKEIEELKGYRAMIDYQADPEFIKTYEEPIQEKLSSIKEILKGLNVAEDVIDAIDYNNTAALTATKRLIASVGNDEILADDFFSDAKEVSRMMKKREEALKKYRVDHKQIVETKKKESFTKQAESEGKIQKRLHDISELKDDKGETRFPFLKEMTAKDPANVAEVEQVERHNKAVAFMKGKLDSALKAETPEDKAEVAVAAVAAHWVTAQLNAALKKIESLQTELGKISKSTTETPRSQKTTINRNGNKENLDLDDALGSFMNGAR